MVVGLGKDRQSLPVVEGSACRLEQKGSRSRAWKDLKTPFSRIFRRFLESEESLPVLSLEYCEGRERERDSALGGKWRWSGLGWSGLWIKNRLGLDGKLLLYQDLFHFFFSFYYW